MKKIGQKEKKNFFKKEFILKLQEQILYYILFT